MVEVEIRTPGYNEETQELEWNAVSLVRAEDGSLTIYGDESAIPQDSVMNPATGGPVHFNDDPEEWARNLPHAYRAGDLVAVVLRDDNAATVEEAEPEHHEPEIPEPPAAAVFESDPAEAASASH